MWELLGKEEAEQVLDHAAVLFESLCKGKAVERAALHVVIARSSCDGNYAVIAERSFGSRAAWLYPYDEIAHGKARMTARTGLSSKEVLLMRPDLLAPGDIKFWGSAILGSLVVACSGVQPWYDHAMANIILSLCAASIEQRQDEANSREGITYPQ